MRRQVVVAHLWEGELLLLLLGGIHTEWNWVEHLMLRGEKHGLLRGQLCGCLRRLLKQWVQSWLLLVLRPLCGKRLSLLRVWPCV
jgi:hypothetical protein